MARKKGKKRLYLDVETTGPEKLVHGIHQIAGLIEIDNKIVTDFDFNCAPLPDQDIDPDALKVSGVTKNQIMRYPTAKDIFSKLIYILNEADDDHYPDQKFTIVGYNVGFDVDFTQAFFLNNNNREFGAIQNWKYVDVLAFVRLMIDWGDKELGKLPNHRLETVCRFFAIRFNPHDALEDIHATRTLYKLLKQRMIKLMKR